MKKIYEIAALGEPLCQEAWSWRSSLTADKTLALEEFEQVALNFGSFELREIEVPAAFDFQAYCHGNKEMQDMFRVAYNAGYKVLRRK